MRSQFSSLARSTARPISRQAADRAGLRSPAIGTFAIAGQGQIRLPTGHGQPDIGENLGVEQCAVQVAPGVVHTVALAKGVKAVALPG